MLPDLRGFFFGLIVFGAGIGLVLAYGMPWLWALVKGWLHAITA